jgi:hypothetical protein
MAKNIDFFKNSVKKSGQTVKKHKVAKRQKTENPVLAIAKAKGMAKK